jgi:hypothetical protein
MFEILQELLKSKYDYDLNEYAIYETKREASKLPKITIGLFLVAVVLYLLNVTGVFENFINLTILFVLLVVLVFLPLAWKKGGKYEAIIVTPKFLIERLEKKEFTVIDFDEITAFQVTKEGICIREKRKEIILGTNLFREEIEPIVDILEAKGKTFDPKKEFMIRPIHISIEDNKITIKDIEVETETDILYEKYHSKFEFLTPGFIDEVLFRNAEVEEAIIDGDHLVLKMDSLEVKGGHPENTSFESIIAMDCIVIFEHVKVSKLILKNLNVADEADQKLKLQMKEMLPYLKKSVVSEWRSTPNKMEMSFGTGVHVLQTAFKYEDVIVGWKKFK